MSLSSQLKKITSDDYLKSVLLTVHQQMVERIFDKGLDANSTQIGTYSEGYMRKRREKGFSGSDKVILEFTGQMRNDYLLLQDGGNFGSGFTNSANYDKSNWVEDTYDKKIFDLTSEEIDLLVTLLNKKLDDTLD